MTLVFTSCEDFRSVRMPAVSLASLRISDKLEESRLWINLLLEIPFSFRQILTPGSIHVWIFASWMFTFQRAHTASELELAPNCHLEEGFKGPLWLQTAFFCFGKGELAADAALMMLMRILSIGGWSGSQTNLSFGSLRNIAFKDSANLDIVCYERLARWVLGCVFLSMPRRKDAGLHPWLDKQFRNRRSFFQCALLLRVVFVVQPPKRFRMCVSYV